MYNKSTETEIKSQIEGSVPGNFAVGGGAARRRSGSKIRKLSRRWAWLKLAGGYLDYMPYYNFGDPETLKYRLDWCLHTWVKERKGDNVRWRGIGCGERDICPVCGSYRQLVLAKEAADSMILAQTAVEVNNIKLKSYGLKLVLTIPKTESARIDKLLKSDFRAWQLEVNGIFKAAYSFIARWFGDGCGGVVSLDFSGEIDPAAAHYHINVYLFPARIKDGVAAPLGHWIEKETLNSMRGSWTSRVNDLFGIRLKQANFNVKYLDSVGQLHHWLQYLYRHSLSDLWRGWQGVDAGQVKYKAGKNLVMELSSDDLGSMTRRLALISSHFKRSHFKRIRWFGIFSDGQRSKTMKSLGLESVDMEIDDDGETESWTRDGEVAKFVRYDLNGVILRMYGDTEFLVTDNLVNYSPSSVSIGKRKRWKEPGST